MSDIFNLFSGDRFLMNITFYKVLATYFRKAFEDIDLSNAPGFLPNFPDGCCFWTAKFIGQYLVDEHKLSPQHVHATCHPDHDGDGHEWIVVENIIIDITADQFNKNEAQFSKIIVCDVNSSKWHNEWKNISKDSLFNGFLKHDKIATDSDKTKCTVIYNMICETVRFNANDNAKGK